MNPRTPIPLLARGKRRVHEAPSAGDQNSQEVTARVPSRAAIRWKCAFTYMNAVFRKNLTDAFEVDANDVDTALRHRAAHSTMARQSAVLPDDSDMHLGRERPPAGRAWGEEGGSQMGVAHAPVVSLLGCDSGADSDTGGTERRRRQARGR